MNYPQVLVSLVIFVIFVLLGLPVWWNTTKVYRAYLPHERIMAAQKTAIRVGVGIEIFHEETDLDSANTIGYLLDKNRVLKAGIHSFELNFILRKNNVNYNDLNKHCNKLVDNVKINESLSYRFFLFRDVSFKSRSFYCNHELTTIISLAEFNVTAIGVNILSLMETYLNVKEVSTYLQTLDEFNEKKHNPNPNMPPSVAYCIVLTLAVANPSDYMPSWNIEDSLDQYLKPFLTKLDFLGDIKVSSQVVYYVDFKEKPSKDGKRFYYAKDKLPLLMNDVQPRLMTYTSTDATLHFIVYVPPAKYSPLYIKVDDEMSNSSYTKSFYSARWGGLQIYNPELSENSKEFTISSETLIKTFVFQLGNLFGLRHSLSYNMFPDNKVMDMSAWERSSLMIGKTFEYLNKSLSTLISLYKLLGEIENIVISEDIRFLIQSSLDNYEESIQFLETGYIDAAAKHSKSSFEYSEKAFYDSSLLALLYFPDDQKYAIYVPLFVPITFPIIGSCYRSLIWLKRKKKVD